MGRPSVLVLVVVLGSLPAWASDPSLPNFHRVDEHLYRGGQPGVGGVAALRALGIRTIVNLRDEQHRIDDEADEARALGMNYVSIPMHGLLRPKEDQIARVLALIDDPSNRPVFVHCAAGHDRTGVVVGCYRIARAGWTAERAISEAFQLGMLKIEFAKRAFLREYYEKLRGSMN